MVFSLEDLLRDKGMYEQVATVYDSYRDRMLGAFNSYFIQENEIPTEKRFMAFLSGYLNEDEFNGWKDLYEALKRDIEKDPTMTKPFPWM